MRSLITRGFNNSNYAKSHWIIRNQSLEWPTRMYASRLPTNLVGRGEVLRVEPAQRPRTNSIGVAARRRRRDDASPTPRRWEKLHSCYSVRPGTPRYLRTLSLRPTRRSRESTDATTTGRTRVLGRGAEAEVPSTSFATTRRLWFHTRANAESRLEEASCASPTIIVVRILGERTSPRSVVHTRQTPAPFAKRDDDGRTGGEVPFRAHRKDHRDQLRDTTIVPIIRFSVVYNVDSRSSRVDRSLDNRAGRSTC